MADEADMADERQHKILEAAIGCIVERAPIKIEGNGLCLHCGGIVKPRLVGELRVIGRWCNAGCRDDWEAEQ